jgi:hypothetical protein
MDLVQRYRNCVPVTVLQVGLKRSILFGAKIVGWYSTVWLHNDRTVEIYVPVPGILNFFFSVEDSVNLSCVVVWYCQLLYRYCNIFTKIGL